MISHSDGASRTGGEANKLEADIVVLGAGMAGLTTAGYAASLGIRVIVLEKAPAVGGSAVLSGTMLWTAPDLQSFQELCPRGNDRLGEVLVTNFPALTEWLRSTGVEVDDPRTLLRYGRGQRFDVLTYFKRCQG
jgi:succinate dehydrogenase/fumarate reductase flavoprotein subunit